MSLERSLPLLFALPRRRQSLQGIVASVALALLGLIVYLWSEINSSTPAFLLISLLIGAYGVIVFRTTRMNMMYLFRYVDYR